MHRRILLLAAGALPAILRAEHGWEPYDQNVPLYLEGPVTMIIWADPHAHLEMLQRRDAQVPADLPRRQIPRQRDSIDLARVVSRVAVPGTTLGRTWRVELPSLARISNWGVARPKIKDVIGVVGYPGPEVTGTPTLRAELLLIGNRMYPMRSDPR